MGASSTENFKLVTEADLSLASCGHAFLVCINEQALLGCWGAVHSRACVLSMGEALSSFSTPKVNNNNNKKTNKQKDLSLPEQANPPSWPV